jgi:hypothetical protein
MDAQKFKDGIKKTGFFLEYRIGEVLRQQGWSVISNRYYVDDQSETVREIDLVAYRTRVVQDFTVYTVLLVSCKKTEKNIWAMLARDINPNDPNMDLRPVHLWTNKPVIHYMITQSSWREAYFKHAAAQGVTTALAIPDVEVYAFQEMNKISGAVQNDKPIFSSVTSLMKAQAYELSCLPSRRKDEAVYQFNLLSVVDADLVRMHLKSNDEVEASEVDSENYIADYIINKERTAARIHFVRASAFTEVLQDYLALHDVNCRFFSRLCSQFYADVLKDRRKIAIFKDQFWKRLQWPLSFAINRQTSEREDFEPVYLSWCEKDELLKIEVNLQEETIASLNQNAYLLRATTKLLRELYRYEGRFQFAVYDIPF